MWTDKVGSVGADFHFSTIDHANTIELGPISREANKAINQHFKLGVLCFCLNFDPHK